MKKNLQDLSADGKQELALALLLWKDFKTKGRFDAELLVALFDMADMLGVRKELEFLSSSIPPMSITPRDEMSHYVIPDAG